MNAIILGADIGGSHITTALINSNTRQVLTNSITRIRVDASGSLSDITETWGSAIRTSWSAASLPTTKVGIAMPGPFDYENGICLIKEQEKYRSLYGINVKNLLAQQLAIPADHIKFINDAAAFLEGEVYMGSLKNNRNSMGITLGTGLGSASYINNECVDAGLWNMPFRDGIAEDYISSRWFINEYKARTGNDISGVQELADLYESDKRIAGLFAAFGKNLGHFIELMIGRFDHNSIVIGGNISKAARFFLPHTEEYLYNQVVPADIKISSLGEHAAMIGAMASFDKLTVKKPAA
ncbi:MAG: ROK family protein [Ferruginibacter sp.]